MSRVFLLLAAGAPALGLRLASPTSAPHRVVSRARAQMPRMDLVRSCNTAEFEAAIMDCATPILCDIYATWCGPCQLLAPQLELVAGHYGDKLRVLKIDSDEEPDVADTLQIRGLPTLLLINDMTVVARAEGALMADELKGLVDHHLFGGPSPLTEPSTGETVPMCP